MTETGGRTSSQVVAGREPTVSAHLCCQDARAAIKFYEDVFDGRLEGTPMEEPDGRIRYAPLWFKEDCVSVSDEFAERGQMSPKNLLSLDEPLDKDKIRFSSKITLFVDNVDDVVDKAVNNGAIVLMPALDAPALGRRWARIADPDAHVWFIVAHMQASSSEQVG